MLAGENAMVGLSDVRSINTPQCVAVHRSWHSQQIQHMKTGPFPQHAK